MHRSVAALVAASVCSVPVQAQMSAKLARNPLLTLAKALQIAGLAAPSLDAADAGLRAADAARRVAGLRPNPQISADVENVGGSRAYDVIEAPKQTVSVGLPLELGGKRLARVAVATSQRSRAEIDRAAAAADLREAVIDAYVEAVAADRRLAISRDQARIAAETAHAAQVRVEAGKASPLERQRAEVIRISADAAVQKAQRLAVLARGNLARRIGISADASLDEAWFDRIDSYGPSEPSGRGVTLARAAAATNRRTAEAQLRLARAQRIPDVTLSTGVRRLPATNSVAAVFGVSVPFPLFDGGSAAVTYAEAERNRADALERVAQLDTDQSVAQAEADLANAQEAARATAGPSLEAAKEAARIARIGYREGKFGQLDLLDAERSLAETRNDAINALAAFHAAEARLERLTIAAPTNREDER